MLVRQRRSHLEKPCRRTAPITTNPPPARPTDPRSSSAAPAHGEVSAGKEVSPGLDRAKAQQFIQRVAIVAGLQDSGHDVTEAESGQEGIARFVEVAPDLVILDFLMPGMSGAEVASHILAAKPDQRILFVSGYSETDAIRKVAPDAEILATPFRAAVLDEAVREALATA